MPRRIVAAERIEIQGPAGRLSAIVEDPSAESAGFAVLCHPHPLYGGTMDNKVVTTISRALIAENIACIRFNFRGVGDSEGRYDDGRGETDDAAAVAQFGLRRWPGRSPTLAGFSFGSYVALRLAQRLPPQCLITVAPAVDRFDFAALEPPRCPWLLVQGDADDVVDPQAVRRFAAAHSKALRLAILPGVGHFFHGRLVDLGHAIGEFLRELREIESGAPGTPDPRRQ
jgi:uncharacterized protein